MVTRVFGKVDGAEVIFAPSTVDGKWKCTVPKNETGTYVMEIYAQDDAGNTGYLGTVAFTVDASTLRTQIEWVDVTADTKWKQVLPSIFGTDCTQAAAELSTCRLAASIEPWKFRVESFEPCGR